MSFHQNVPLLLENNRGENLCSLNSIIQILHSIPEFHTQLLELGNASTLLTELKRLISNAGSNMAISALELRRLLALESNMPLNSGDQQDTFELFNYLLDYVPSELFNFNVQNEYRFKIDGQPSGCPTCKRFPSAVCEFQKFLKP